ncbi:MAG: DUF1684 domain-containing protein [Trueperaceae bacterium]|nr:DUF1684 domain-containing protein [Trueperaceae bacterium]
MVNGLISEYEQTQQLWREAYQQKLLADHGWLSTTALNWFEAGETILGSDERSIVALEKTRVPEKLGHFVLDQEKIEFQTQDDFKVIHQGEAVQRLEFELVDNQNAEPFHFREFAFSVIRRGAQYGLRVFDKEADSRKAFKGLRWFAIDPGYRLEAEFIPFAEPLPVTIANILGGTHQSEIPGEARFSIRDHTYTLRPIRSKEGFFFIFRDSSSQNMTYPSGRFLTTSLPSDSKLILDFNQAHNPPCAFTPYATCPLPFKENILDIPILAGEMQYEA